MQGINWRSDDFSLLSKFSLIWHTENQPCIFTQKHCFLEVCIPGKKHSVLNILDMEGYWQFWWPWSNTLWGAVEQLY